MAIKKFNSEEGFSAGYNPIDVIDANGNVIANSNIVTMADLENIVTVPASTNGVSLLRKLSEARSPIATSNIQDPRAGYYTVGGWSFISVTPTII